MADKNWWFNRAGAVAPVSNPGSQVPNYGLTYDLTTAPYDSPDQFDSLAEALGAYLQTGSGSMPLGSGTGSAAVADPTLWDRATGAAGFVGDQISGAVGAAQVGVYKLDQHMPEWSQLEDTQDGTADEILDSTDGWGDMQDLGKAKLGKAMKEVSESPGAEQIFWGLEKLNEYASTAFVAATLSEDDPSAFLKSGTWGDANRLSKERHLNAGEAFAQMFYDKEVLLDEDRFEQIRQHNTIFNVGALAFNVVAAWKMDPNVLAGQTIGKGRDALVGKLATNGRTREVQREILSAPDANAAVEATKQYSSLPDRLRAYHAVSLYDRSLQLREAAKTMGYEEFKNLSAFRHSASGTTMAKLMQDVAHSDADWNLVFRTALGDPDAVGELMARQGAVADKIAAIELKSMPKLEADLARMETRYSKRLAEQGRPQDARIEITRFGDKWLDDEVSALRAEAESLSAHLSTYETHESWINRALPGMDVDTGIIDRNSPNAVFGALDRLGGEGALRRSLPHLGGGVRMWQHDDYSPVSWVIKAPAKPFLKRVGVVSLNDVEDGAGAITSYLDQLKYVRGTQTQEARDRVLSSWAGARNDVERKLVVERVEREAIVALGEKHGLSPELMDRLAKELQSKRKLSWGRFSDTTMYSPIRGKRGKEIEYVDDAGNMTRVKMPVDPTQLANWHPLTNITDLDRTIRLNADTLRSLDADLASRTRAGAAWTERHVRELGEEFGSMFNSFWKPLALLSIRWPMRVVADESMRVILFTGALAHAAQLKSAAGNAIYNTGVVRPYEWWNGRKVKTGSLAEESLRSGARNDFDPFDYRSITNPNAVMPMDSVDLGKIDAKRYDRLNALAAERQRYLRTMEAYEARLNVYHGTGERLPEELLPADEIRADLGQTYGRGLYATDDPAIAHGYAVQSRESGKVYRVGFSGRVFDLDQRPSVSDIEALRSMNEARVSAYLDRHANDDSAEESSDWNQASGFTWQGLFESLPERDSRIRALITAHLKRTRGAEALRYQGGRLSGGGDHNSYVFLYPEKLRASHVRDVREGDNFEPLSRAERGLAEAPSWVKAWDERLGAAEKSPERGFFFDPLQPNKSVKKGFAISAYPGRLRTFDRKPTARELNYWTEKNADVLGVPNNRVAVWLDKDTGRWHLDVVKAVKRREDAMLLASRLESTEFYDIEDGFTRYLSEDFWGHFSSPFVKPTPDPEAPSVGADQAPIFADADMAGAEIGNVGIGSAPTRKAVGFGTTKWRSRDGRVVKGEGVFGADTKNPNIYYGVVSSRDPIRNLFGGYTKGLGLDRASRQGSDYRVFDPNDPDANLDHWATAYAHFVNNHIRYSPIASKMLEGKSDDEIFDWLHTAKGREVRKRMGIRGENPAKWVTDIREIFDHMFPTERALEAARLGEVDPKRVLDLIPEGLRPEVHGDTIKMGLGTSEKLKTIGKVVDKLMTYLGSAPTDALVRHPFAQSVYNREMRNYLSSVPADKITNNVLAAAEASARAEAIKRVRRMLYNIADEREGVHMLRFVSPFFQAQVEVLERYAHLAMEKPETVARLAQLLVGSQTLNTGLWQVTDREGKPAKGYHSDNQVIFQVTPTLRGLVDKIPGLQGALDNAGDITVPVASLNLVLQGDKPYLPSMGPIVTYPASEFYFNDRPELEGNAIYSWLYPFGQARGDNFMDRGINATIPAWMRRTVTGGTEDLDDPAFARRVSEIGAAMLMAWEDSGREGPRPTPEQALEAAKNEYRLRAASSFFLPAPLTPRSPYQFWIDQYRAFREKHGAEADEKFYDEYGPSFYMFAQQSTQAAGGMGPNVGEKRAFDKYKRLAQTAPDMIGILTGPFATEEFSDAVYNWQLNTRLSPDSDQKLRERLSPSERIARMEVSRGWVEYGKLASAIDAELRARVAQGGSAYLTASANADLASIKSAKLREIIERNPAWQDAFNSRASSMGSFLGQAYSVAFDEQLDGRTDIEALRTYLISRARLQDALRQREDVGQSSSDQLSFDPMGNPVGDNADLGAAWLSYVNELKARNLQFAEIYNRYLEGDDLSTYIPPEVSGG